MLVALCAQKGWVASIPGAGSVGRLSARRASAPSSPHRLAPVPQPFCALRVVTSCVCTRVPGVPSSGAMTVSDQAPAEATQPV